MRVIVTRPPAQAAAWVASLHERGIAAEALPLIDVAPPDDAAALQAAWADLATRALVMFVSVNAVQHFFAERPPGCPWPPQTLAGATGPGTAAALLGAGVPAPLCVAPPADAASFDSEALWALLAAREWRGQRVLVVRGDGGRDWLARTLREHGAQVDFVTAYRRLAPTFDAAARGRLVAALAAPAEHLWLFSSSQAVRHLQACMAAAGVQPAAASRAAASHERIVQAARDAGFGRVDLVAPTLDAVTALVHGNTAPTVGQTAVDTIGAPVTETSHTPAAAAPAPTSASSGWLVLGAVVLAALTAGALVLSWNTEQRVKTLESELVKRQTESGGQASEARMAAREAQASARETAAKMALLEARVAETTMQRGQLEDLIQSMARSRDENVLADVETAIRVAMQQSAITGSAEPLVLTLKQADERLARYNQPRLERVRHAVAKDLERTKAAGGTDIAVLTIRLDEAIRAVDELPLLSAAERHPSAPPTPARPGTPAPPVAGAAAHPWLEQWRHVGEYLWQQVRSLIRVTRIDEPEAMLVAPDQAWFLRENLKLRLLNARLALLSRQFDATQGDLRDALAALNRYFDRSSRRVTSTITLVHQVATQARLVSVPRPDATLAAIATASAGR